MYSTSQCTKIAKRVDNYIIYTTQQLGKGTFSRVLKGKYVDGTAEFAIKVIEKKYLKKYESLRSVIYNQISLLKNVRSQNVVKLEQVIQTPHNLYLIRQYCNGGSLRQYLKAQQIQQQAAKKMVQNILAGLLHLQKYNSIRKILIPQSIFVHNGVLKIADLGQRCNIQSQRTSSVFLTSLYSSPQILKEQKYCSKSQVWSLGLIAYQIIHGVHPYFSKNKSELIMKIQTKKLQFSHLISSCAKDFITKCLALNEKHRMSWEEVYRHPFVADSFKLVIQNRDRLEIRIKSIIKLLNSRLAQLNYDLQQLLKPVVYTNESRITKKQLFKLMLQFDRNICMEQVYYLFDKLAKDGQKSIQLPELKAVLCQGR